jgi:hypothetical protein
MSGRTNRSAIFRKACRLCNWRRGRDSIIAIASKSWWFLDIAIIPCVYEGFKHILNLGSVVCDDL